MPVNKKLFLSAVSSEFIAYRTLLAQDLKRPNLDVAVQEDFIVTGERMNIEPYAIMLSKDDLAFKQWVDTQMADLISRGDLHRIYQKWFESPIAPGGINLQLPMPRLLRESLFFPTDKVND